MVNLLGLAIFSIESHCEPDRPQVEPCDLDAAGACGAAKLGRMVRIMGQRRRGTGPVGEQEAQMDRISVVKTDITTLDVDAIVNAANTTLLGGGGVDGAIHRAAGPELFDECEKLGGCATGGAKLTKGYRLPARYVIHTVGPVWTGGDRGERDLLASCYRECFRIAREQRFRTIAFPAISCGVYRFPVDEAVKIAIRETQEELKKNERIEKVIFACFTNEVYSEFRRGVDPVHQLR
jgi:O-acetyl-ADP-ribose deacetylase (regulator of RNase III)